MRGLDSAGRPGLRREAKSFLPALAAVTPAPPPTSIPELPLVPEELLEKQKGSSTRDACPRSAEIRGPSSEDVPAPTADLACPPKQAGHAGRREEGHGSCKPAESQPASQPARPAVARPQPPGTWARAPQAPAPSCREPRPAAAATSSSRLSPGPGVGLGAGAEPGPRPVSGCSGNGDVPLCGRGQHAGCIF